MTQTTLNLFSKRILSAFVATAIISGCASQTIKQPKTPETNKSAQEVQNTPVVMTAKDYILAAENKPPLEAINLLFNATRTYLDEGNYVESLWLTNKLSELPLSNSQQYNLLLLQTENLLASQKLQNAEKHLQQSNAFIEESSLIHSYKYFELVSLYEEKQKNTILSANALLTAYNINPEPSEDNIFQLWDKISRLSDWEISQLSQHNPPLLDGWLNLLEKAQRSGEDKLMLDQELVQFQFEFPNHPAKFIADQLLLVTAVEPSTINNVAVIIPLSGKHEKIGNIIQQGILAAYNNESTLHFIDSNQLDFSELSTIFEDKNIDHIVGPLLKNNVDQYISLLELNVPTVLLNTPTIPRLRDQHFAFSIKREDEAAQAATILSSQSFKQPVVFATRDRVSQRIASTFAQKWDSLNGKLPEKILLESNRNMQNSLKSGLDIDASKKRIRTLEANIRQSIEKETRNRRDIDMIYLAAPAKYTRMIKPLIDVNTSTYADSIPIFASSLSHSGNNKMSEIRDLSGLTFSEIPWLLNSEQQDSEAVKVSNTLWPNRQESLQRIYAMAYDVLPLLNKLNVLKQQPYSRFKGQTGEIKLDKNNVFSRSLLWGQFTNGEVKRIEMEHNTNNNENR